MAKPQYKSIFMLRLLLYIYIGGTVYSRIQGFSSVVEASMDYEMTIYFQQKWIDSRLAWGSSPRSNKRRKGNMNQIHSQLVERLWRPGKRPLG